MPHLVSEFDLEVDGQIKSRLDIERDQKKKKKTTESLTTCKGIPRWEEWLLVQEPGKALWKIDHFKWVFEDT